jgi:hypothetical protein
MIKTFVTLFESHLHKIKNAYKKGVCHNFFITLKDRKAR